MDFFDNLPENLRVQEHLSVSAEDRFVVLAPESIDHLFPSALTIENLAYAIGHQSLEWQFLLDLRFADQGITEDIIEGYQILAEGMEDNRRSARDSFLLTKPDEAEELSSLAEYLGMSVLPMRPKPLPMHTLDLRPFQEGLLFIDASVGVPTPWETLQPSDVETIRAFLKANNIAPNLDAFHYSQEDEEEFLDELEWDLDNLATYEDPELERIDERSRYLDKFLRSIASNSILSEVALVETSGKIRVIPYHSNSLHRVIEKRSDDLVLVQPARLSMQYWATFESDILRLEKALNRKSPSELEIENILTGNPLFLRSLNYSEMYSQVVLPRNGASSLRPDVIAKPVGSQWWDIIDFKLPNQKLLVGRDNRKSLSAALTQAVAQLREYSAYFDDRKMSQHVEKKFGFRCHKPKMMVIVGRDPSAFDSAELRRALTAHPTLEIVSYDRLLVAARHMLLL